MKKLGCFCRCCFAVFFLLLICSVLSVRADDGGNEGSFPDSLDKFFCRLGNILGLNAEDISSAHEGGSVIFYTSERNAKYSADNLIDGGTKFKKNKGWSSVRLNNKKSGKVTRIPMQTIIIKCRKKTSIYNVAFYLKGVSAENRPYQVKIFGSKDPDGNDLYQFRNAKLKKSKDVQNYSIRSDDDYEYVVLKIKSNRGGKYVQIAEIIIKGEDECDSGSGEYFKDVTDSVLNTNLTESSSIRKAYLQSGAAWQIFEYANDGSSFANFLWFYSPDGTTHLAGSFVNQFGSFMNTWPAGNHPPGVTHFFQANASDALDSFMYVDQAGNVRVYTNSGTNLAHLDSFTVTNTAGNGAPVFADGNDSAEIFISASNGANEVWQFDIGTSQYVQSSMSVPTVSGTELDVILPFAPQTES